MSMFHRTLACAIGFSLLASIASADNERSHGHAPKLTYTGTFCQPSSPFLSNLVTYSVSGAFNLDEPVVNLTCPITRTRAGTRRGMTVKVMIAGFGIATEIPIGCTLASMSADGFEIKDTDPEYVHFVGDGSDVREELNLRVETADRDGYFVLTCSLTKDYAVVKYDVTEP